MSEQVRVASTERKARLRGQDADVAWLEAALFEADPIGINFEENTDEYRPEAETIMLRRSEATNLEDVQRIVHAEFVKWFDEGIAGPPERYEHVAGRIWQRWSVESTLDITTD